MKQSAKLGITLAGALAFTVTSAQADTFGSGGNAFTIDFVNIGNAGNADDARSVSGLGSPYGGVSYAYRMGTYEISQVQIEKATASGLANVTAGPWSGNQPATNMTWYKMAAFVNWLNTSTGHQAAYQLTGVTSLTPWASVDAWQADGENLYRHKDAFYFLPSEDEWYKAAFHKNDGVTANYWDYATGSNAIPDGLFNGDPAFDLVFTNDPSQPSLLAPNAVSNVGLASPYGTFGQTGNVWDSLESDMNGSNTTLPELLVLRGGYWNSTAAGMRFPIRAGTGPSDPNSSGNVGFRVASVVPEPSSAVLIGSGLVLLARRRRPSCSRAR